MVMSMSWSNDDRMLASVGVDGCLYEWDTNVCALAICVCIDIYFIAILKEMGACTERLQVHICWICERS